MSLIDTNLDVFLRFELINDLLFSENAFNHAFSSLSESSAKYLWQTTESNLIGIIPGLSLEHIQSLRNKTIFSKAFTKTNPLKNILKQQGREILEHHGGKAIPRITPKDHEEPDPLANWRWLNFSLPPELILAASWDLNGPFELGCETPLVSRHWMDQGLVQTHVHLGAQTDFPTYWAGTMNAIGQDHVHAQIMSSPGSPFEDGVNLAPWMIASANARLVLFGFLICLDLKSEKAENFSTYLQIVLESVANDFGLDKAYVLSESLHSLLAPLGVPSVGFQDMQMLYRILSRNQDNKLIKRLSEVWTLDPLVRMGPNHIPPAHREVYWQRLAFQYLESETGKNDRYFAILFWQVIRLKVILYRYIVQRPMVKGLQWFIRHYDRIGLLNDQTKSTRLEQAYYMDGGSRGLKSLEVRMAPAAEPSEFREKLYVLVKSWQQITGKTETELGIVLHLPKFRNCSKPSINNIFGHHWADSFANPENNPTSHYRFSQFVNLKQMEVNAVQQVLSQVPLSLALIRGLDLCTDEISIPNWVMFPLLKQMEQAGHEASRQLSYLHPNWKIPGLRRTIHVGEDFHHLLDGIRRMDEVITRLPLQIGDRIGHGLALGLAPKRWSQQHPVVWMPKEIRLWDLVWEWKQYQQGSLEVSISRLEKVKSCIAKYTFEIFGPSCCVEDVCQLYEDLFDESKLFLVGFPNGEQVIPERHYMEPTKGVYSGLYWLHHYLTSNACFAKGQEVIEVHNGPDEQTTLLAMQRWVRRSLIERDITIEINPSSNFLIADLQNLSHHPLWNLNPPPGHQMEEDMGPPINICIGSDDPITFATNLPQEYELLYNVLHQKGLGREPARLWMARLRQAGLDCRFTLGFGHRNSESDQVWEHLARDLNPAD